MNGSSQKLFSPKKRQDREGRVKGGISGVGMWFLDSVQFKDSSFDMFLSQQDLPRLYVFEIGVNELPKTTKF